MKAFLIGLAVVLISLISSLAMQDYKIAIKISGAFGMVSVALAGIISGAFASGDRVRANYSVEDKEDRNRRYKWSLNLFLAGVTNIVLAATILLIK